MQQYHYTWGTEDIPSASIIVIKDGEIYTITLSQTAFSPDCFGDILVMNGILLRREVRDIRESTLSLRTIVLTIRAKNNPRPETLFKLDE